MDYQVFKLVPIIMCAILMNVVGLKLINPNQAIVILNQGRVGITTVNSETRITVDGARVTELCSQPLAQDLQMALQQLVSRNNSSIDHRRNHRRKTRSHLIDPFIAEAETEMDALINEINARIRVAEDQRRAIQLAKARFTNTIQEKLGSNFTIQSIIVVDNNCILVNGKPINKLLL